MGSIRHHVTMPRSSARTLDVAALALEYGEQVLRGPVEQTHRSVARAIFKPTRLLGGRLPERIHDAVAGVAYSAMSQGLRASSAAARSMAAQGVGSPIESTHSGRQVLAAINGLVGAQLRDQADPQAIDMAIRVGGQDIELARWSLRQAFPSATGHIVVFVHGLCESDESWLIGTASADPYPQRVASDTLSSPVVLRYNTGLSIVENGRRLDTLLSQLLETWPEHITRISLVGHGMGALVARAATNHATAAARTWPHAVREVVCLGEPQAGANWERAAHATALMLSSVGTKPSSEASRKAGSEAAPVAYGRISSTEWHGRAVTDLWGTERIAAAPLTRAVYHFVSLDQLEVVPGVGKFTLLNHRLVGEWLVGWINARDRSPRAITSR